MAQSDQLMAELGLTTLAAMETYSNAGFAGCQFSHEIWSVDSQITRLGYQWRRQSSSWRLVVSEEAVLLQRVLGTPNEDTWPGVTSLPDYKSSFPKWSPKDLAAMVPNLEPSGVDLLCKMLCLDPSKRITARSALEHEYFRDVAVVP